MSNTETPEKPKEELKATTTSAPAAVPDPAKEKVAEAEDRMKDVKFPTLDSLASHFYDNEAGTFWVGLNLRADPIALPLFLDAAKLALLQSSLDFRAREARKQSLIARVKESGADLKEGLEKMMGRLADNAKKSARSFLKP